MNIEEAKIIIRSLKIYYEDEKGQRDLDKEKAEMILDKQDIQAIETLLTAYEKEKEKNKELENDLKDMTKRYMEAESVKFWYNYIHKDKIRKMLQELEDRRNKQPVIGYWSKKAMLEKLLKEE